MRVDKLSKCISKPDASKSQKRRKSVDEMSVEQGGLRSPPLLNYELYQIMIYPTAEYTLFIAIFFSCVSNRDSRSLCHDGLARLPTAIMGPKSPGVYFGSKDLASVRFRINQRKQLFCRIPASVFSSSFRFEPDVFHLLPCLKRQRFSFRWTSMATHLRPRPWTTWSSKLPKANILN